MPEDFKRTFPISINPHAACWMPQDPDWIDFSGPLTAASTITSWTDLVSTAVPECYYRILEAP